MKKLNMRLANLPEDYKKIGVNPNHTEVWEDGLRTDGREGSYEWWYVDSKFDNGLTVVVVFYTKDHFDSKGPALPTADIDITYPDGSQRHETSIGEKGNVIDASTKKCDVRINKSYLIAEGKDRYHIHYEDQDIIFDAIINSIVPSFRAKTGHIYFGNHDENYFAWYVAQPAAKIEAELIIGNHTQQLNGSSYHDHNWGNVNMNNLMSHWYWGRATVGDYTVIACDIIAGKKYGYTRQPVFMLAKNGVIVADDPFQTAIERNDRTIQPVTKKFMDNHLTYTYKISNTETYVVEFIREKDIISVSLLTVLPKIKAFFAKLIGMNPTYCRVIGEVRITHEYNGEKNICSSQGLWEQMFFDNNVNGELHNYT